MVSLLRCTTLSDDKATKRVRIVLTCWETQTMKRKQQIFCTVMKAIN